MARFGEPSVPMRPFSRAEAGTAKRKCACPIQLGVVLAGYPRKGSLLALRVSSRLHLNFMGA
jgi:hypothetical protein